MSLARPSARPARAALSALAVAALALTGIVVTAAPASAATLTVTSFVDSDGNDACTDPSVLSLAAEATLRNALCVASNVGGASTITVPTGVYTLSDGALVLGTTPGTEVELISQGGQATIVGDGETQLLTIDPDLVGGISVDITGFVFEQGHDTLYGGGAIIGGSYGAADPDSLSIRDSTFSDNSSAAGTDAPGGAIQFIGGDLTVEGSTFEQNDAAAASGGAIYYESKVAGDSLSVSGSRFDGNTVSTAGGFTAGGGAIAFDTNGVGSVEITDNVFTENVAQGSSDGVPALGGAIQQIQGSATISRNVFSENGATGSAAGGGAVDAADGALVAQYNSFVGNTGAAALRAASSAPADATENWWGCNTGPGGSGCDTAVLASGSSSPYLVLSAAIGVIAVEKEDDATLTASLLTDSAGEDVPAAQLSAFDDLSVAFAGSSPSGASVSPAQVEFSDGVASTVYTAGSTTGPGAVQATFDAATVIFSLTVTGPPAFTSAATATAVVGEEGSFTISASGYPTPTISLLSGVLPTGLEFTGASGSATLSGTPATGTAGLYPITFRASANGLRVDQTLMLIVEAAPSAPTPATATVKAGEDVDLTFAAEGSPAPTLSTTGTVPAGLTFTDNGDGSAQLTGTPGVDPGTYEFTVVAENEHDTASTLFTLTITAQPRFLSENHTTFTVGTAGSFPIEVAAGFPTTGLVTLDADAPSWLSLSGDQGSQQLVGTPPEAGTVQVTLSVEGIDGTVAQDFTLTVNEAPLIDVQPENVSALAGADASFTAEAHGTPTPSVQWQRYVDGAWTDIADATAPTLTIPTTIADDGARVRAVFTNAAGTATSDEAQLTVGETPVISPVEPVAVLAGAPVTITVTTSGSPQSALTVDAVPAWLTFTDNGDGTATLSGTPSIDDAGESTLTVTADNGFAVVDEQIEISVADTVALADPMPTPDGELSGVPETLEREQEFTVTGTGFLPGSTVQLGIYSTPTPLGTAVVDDSGAFRAAVAVPADQTLGAHTVAASGIGTGGVARLLAADTTVIETPDGGDDSDASSAADGTSESAGSSSAAASAAGTADASAGASADAGNDADSSSDAGAEADAGSETDAGSEADAGSESGADAASEAGSAADADAEAGSADTGSADPDGAGTTASGSAGADTASSGADGDVATDDSLSSTGSDATLSLVLGGIALLVILAGAAFLLLGRRKRGKSEE